MKIIDLIERSDINQDSKAKRRFQSLKELLDELGKLDISEEIVSFINQEVDKINNFRGSLKILSAELSRITNKVLALLKKKHGIVKKNHYQNLWMVLGMSVYGLPLGVILGAALDNMGLIGIGIPLGMIFGMAMGSMMDKKAEREGRVLAFSSR